MKQPAAAVDPKVQPNKTTKTGGKIETRKTWDGADANFIYSL